MTEKTGYALSMRDIYSVDSSLGVDFRQKRFLYFSHFVNIVKYGEINI